ncbi:hypothetical protein BDF22DRAFT_316892 [Syncephalis plumigaleata]|nr:hypothetical protein BDF22DRAFT_316892 [Syncephalis plumigaleata]
MGQVPSRGPIDPNYRRIPGRPRSRSRGSLLSKRSSTVITAASSGPDHVRSFLSADGDSDTIFGRLDREEHRLHDGVWVESSSSSSPFYQSILGSPLSAATTTTTTSRHGLCNGGTRCSHTAPSPIGSSIVVDRKLSVPGPQRSDIAHCVHSSNGCCECTCGNGSNGDDRPRRSTLPVLSSSTCSASNCSSSSAAAATITSNSSFNHGRSWIRTPLGMTNETSHRMEYAEQSIVILAIVYVRWLVSPVVYVVLPWVNETLQVSVVNVAWRVLPRNRVNNERLR